MVRLTFFAPIIHFDGAHDLHLQPLTLSFPLEFFFSLFYNRPDELSGGLDVKRRY